MLTVIIGLGLATDESVELADFGDADTSFLNYPLHPIVCEEPDTLMNIVWICIDSWNYRTLQPDCAPNIYRLSERGQRYTNHFSGANETMNGTFGRVLNMALYSQYSQTNCSSMAICWTPILVPHYFILLLPRCIIVVLRISERRHRERPPTSVIVI